MQNKYIEGEWIWVKRAEQKFLRENEKKNTPGWQEKIARFVPEKLEDTLKSAFFKAFELIFEKGTGLIEKTYSKEKKKQKFEKNECDTRIWKNKKSLQAFGKTADASRGLHMAFSAVEGVGMGVLGLGLPDIPLFLSALLRSIYEQALSYGFSYDTEEEQIFILKLIEAALSHGDALNRRNGEIDRYIRELETSEEEKAREKLPRRHRISLDDQIRRTSDVLAEEMLYLKFVQGMPIVGIAGGISDMVYQKKISEFTAIKYKRRFLEKKGAEFTQ